jgi:putative heme-binding domain-containing protein
LNHSKFFAPFKIFTPSTQGFPSFAMTIRRLILALLACSAAALIPGSVQSAEPGEPAPGADAPDEQLFARDNLVAWCIVPFDAKKRGPRQRSAMLKRLGIRRLAFDYRAEHIPTFEAEIQALRENGIELSAWWFPSTLNDEARHILDLLTKHKVKTQLWVTGSGPPTGSEEEQRQRVHDEAKRIRPIAQAAAKIGCTVGLYNHGGWFGEPENQIQIIQHLGLDNVGIAYNLHHGHEHLDRFPELLAQMKPYLLTLNLNGMEPQGDQHGQKILPLAAGSLDAALLETIRDSGYRGPIGILNHTDHDAEARLQDNLDGLDWLVKKLAKAAPGDPPKYRTYPEPKQSPASQDAPHGPGLLVKPRAEFRLRPLTVECRVRLTRRDAYNILVACEPKSSPTHWEIFSMAKTGRLTVYLPGMVPDHVHSEAQICDDRWHHVAMLYEADRVRLLLDGKPVADQKVTIRNGREHAAPRQSPEKAATPAKLAIGRLVEGGLFCTGDIRWVRVSSGLREIPTGAALAEEQDAVDKPDSATEKKSEKNTLLLWRNPAPADGSAQSTSSQSNSPTVPAATPIYDPRRVARELEATTARGNAHRGAMVFAMAKLACLSCHRLGQHGGNVGPELTTIARQRTPRQIIESVLWPKREVEKRYVAETILTDAGTIITGYVPSENKQQIQVFDTATGQLKTIATIDIDQRHRIGTLMPDGLASSISDEQRYDLFRFLTALGTPEDLKSEELHAILEHRHGMAPAEFTFERAPLDPQRWPYHTHPVNRDRIYDFYAKQADYFRRQAMKPQTTVAHLLPEFPGLDGGRLGHWGNQAEETWADDRWNDVQLGSVLCGIFHAPKLTVARGVCVRLGEHGELATCFNPDTLQYEALWSGGFVEFSSVRHGFLGGLKPVGTLLPLPAMETLPGPARYRGFYRHGNRVIFAYRIGGVEYLDAPWVENGKFHRIVKPRAEHPLREWTEQGGPPRWPREIITRGELGQGQPYAIDTITLPRENPYNALFYVGDHDFLPDGSAMVCTMQGDVWHVQGLDHSLQQVRWRRFASGLHHALGLIAGPDGLFVQGRDQLTRLQDLNHDGEADFYECYSTAMETSAAGHDFICGLERDPEGNFYTASGNQGLLRITPDGRRCDVLATGFRNPDGLGIMPDGTITVPCSEGDWTPASMICAVVPRDEQARGATTATSLTNRPAPHFGYQGPRDGQAPELPLVYLPRGLDNSSGASVYVDSDRWGPMQGQMVHLSFGQGRHFLLLQDEVAGQRQGAVVPLPGGFRSGVHRGTFNPADGQLYVSGMTGWGTYTPEDGCFQRVRYTGQTVQTPLAFHVHQNGVAITFAQPLDSAIARQASSHFAQCWNYRYSAAYGSPEYSSRHAGTPGHDPLRISAAHVLEDRRTLFLELPDLQPVNQLHLRLRTDAGDPHDMFLTVHALDAPYTSLPGYRPVEKIIAAHPILSDMAWTAKRIPNPWRRRIRGFRPIELEVGKNLTFTTRSISVQAGEPIGLTLVNPDVVPHNWVLVQPGRLQAVGQLANRLVADPEAVVRHYVPESDDVIVYTDIVSPRNQTSIFFRAPQQPGRYPFLCTFPGHWMVMNGEMIVTEAPAETPSAPQ